ncbi:hypothetical protein JQS43_00480 [Natronosporangium hydrolyticum]|uniref:Uncharacterized protein n=1 Tax=Natronosporangium hydrolyticum TaxID=2811111 RepID=A0A895YM02_9ACTN|nr:hypothetical protein [Natronosporangium hydrolyticum]QSB14908.1 hypothetical protein JQS43_00480 [Natronosporangium hydrolyticum]
MEWQHLVAAPTTAAALARWQRLEPELARYPDLAAVRTAVHDRTDLDSSDLVLAALVRLAATTGHSDTLAARVVLQLLIPGAIRLGQRLATMVGDRATSEAVVFAELAILIRTYPWQRRPRRIAANLLLDCRQRLIRSHHRTRPEICAGLTLHEPSGLVDHHHHDDRLGLNDLLWWARRRGILNKLEAQLLVASHVAEIPMNQLVSRFGRSRSTLFAIRASAEARLRHALTGAPASGARGGATGSAATGGGAVAGGAAAGGSRPRHANRAIRHGGRRSSGPGRA